MDPDYEKVPKPVPEFPAPDFFDAPPGTIFENPHGTNSSVKYRWVCKGWNCPVCQVLSNRIYSLEYWSGTVQPGFHNNCDCSLVPVYSDAPESAHDLFDVDYWVLNTHRGFLDQIFRHRFNWIMGLAEDYAALAEAKGDMSVVPYEMRGIIGYDWEATMNTNNLWGPYIDFLFGNKNYPQPGIPIDMPNTAVMNYKMRFETLIGTYLANISAALKPVKNPGAGLPWENRFMPKVKTPVIIRKLYDIR